MEPTVPMAPVAEVAPAATMTGVVVRLLVGALVFGAIAVAWQAPIIAHLMPAVRGWIDLVDDTFRTVDLRAAPVNGELLIVRLATPAVIHVLGNHVVAVDPRTVMSTAMSAGILLQPLVLAGALLMAWPWQGWREPVLRIILAAPLMAVVVLLDVPTMLYAMLWNQEVAALEPERFSPLIDWSDFMNAGGRFALTVVAVALAVGLARQLAARASRRAPAAPAPAATALPAVPPSR